MLGIEHLRVSHTPQDTISSKSKPRKGTLESGREVPSSCCVPTEPSTGKGEMFARSTSNITSSTMQSGFGAERQESNNQHRRHEPLWLLLTFLWLYFTTSIASCLTLSKLHVHTGSVLTLRAAQLSGRKEMWQEMLHSLLSRLVSTSCSWRCKIDWRTQFSICKPFFFLLNTEIY